MVEFRLYNYSQFNYWAKKKCLAVIAVVFLLIQLEIWQLVQHLIDKTSWYISCLTYNGDQLSVIAYNLPKIVLGSESIAVNRTGWQKNIKQ